MRRSRTGVQILNRLRAEVTAPNGERRMDDAYPSPIDVYRDTQLIPRARQELEDDPYSNPIQFALTTHFMIGTDPSRQVLAQNKRRQFLLIQNLSGEDPTVALFVNFGNDASVLSGLSIAGGESVIFDQHVPNNSVHLFINAQETTQIVIIEGSPEL
jgi:hypothetical protein